MDNKIKSPSHYTAGDIEAKDALKSMFYGAEMSAMAFYWWGCAFKYLWRWPRKNKIEDLEKCKQCIDFLVEEIQG